MEQEIVIDGVTYVRKYTEADKKAKIEELFWHKVNKFAHYKRNIYPAKRENVSWLKHEINEMCEWYANFDKYPKELGKKDYMTFMIISEYGSEENYKATLLFRMLVNFRKIYEIEQNGYERNSNKL